MDKLSTIIITYNEEQNIAATLDAAWKVSDEIIVMDSGSEDKTKDICIEKGVTFFTQKWLGFGEQRNLAAAKVKNPYILVLDADEVLSRELMESILLLKKNGFTEKVYSLKRLNFYYGKFIHYGMENPDVKPRLYHKDFATWNNKLVHEGLEFGHLKATKLRGYLFHYTYRTISEHLIKADKYTSLAAEGYFNSGKKKPGFVKLFLSPAFTFIKAFIFKRGFLDGWHGWILAKMHANGVLIKYAKLRMMYQQKPVK